MAKLNNLVSSLNAERACWINATQVAHLGPGFPKGLWARQNQFYPDPGGAPFEGFQWRNNTALNFNYLWIQHYYGQTSTMSVKFDHLVVARNYNRSHRRRRNASAPSTASPER